MPVTDWRRRLRRVDWGGVLDNVVVGVVVFLYGGGWGLILVLFHAHLR
jgi:hypothetical protein